MSGEQRPAAMTCCNEALTKAGVMLAGEGLESTAQGARVRFDRAGCSVIDGP